MNPWNLLNLSSGGGSRRRIRPLIQLDVGAPRIRDERERAVGLLVPRIRTVDLAAGRLVLLQERLQILHIEADVIEHPSLRRHLHRIVHRF